MKAILFYCDECDQLVPRGDAECINGEWQCPRHDRRDSEQAQLVTDGGTERSEDYQCHECGSGLDSRLDDHFVLTEEPRPIPDKKDMEFDDWFRANWILCPECAPDLDCAVQTAADQGGGE